MEQLLKKLREMTTLLQNEKGLVSLDTSYRELPFNAMAHVLSRITQANIYIVDNVGMLVGYDEIYTMKSERFSRFLNTKQFPKQYIKALNQLKQTSENITVDNQYTAFPVENKDLFYEGITTIIPIFVSGKRLGNLILARLGKLFEYSDLILAEYSATVAGLELLHYINQKEQEMQREKDSVEMAINSLSYSEKIAIKHIFEDINGLDVRITASKIANENNITRSVIVNALRKLESAGLLESQSLGMKGTHIQINNEEVLNYLQTFL